MTPQLVASLVDSVAWPFVALVLVPLIVVVFRDDIKKLIRRINRIGAGDKYVDFGPVYDPERFLTSPGVEETGAAPEFIVPEDERDAEDYIESNPHLAVLQSWGGLEQYAFQLLPEAIGPIRATHR